MARPRTVSKLVYEDKETGCHIIEYADVGHIVSTFLSSGALTTGGLKNSCTEKFINFAGKSFWRSHLLVKLHAWSRLFLLKRSPSRISSC